MTGTELSLRIAVALALGAVIGLERQWHHRLAGLRTNALVAIGSAGFVIISGLTQGENSPTRVAAQVASGIGFLGAGVILREGLTVRGLNTAATLWCAAAVGSLAGLGFNLAAVLTTGAVVITNVALRPLGRLVAGPREPGSELEVKYRIEVICRDAEEPHIRALLLQAIAAAPLMLNRVRRENVPETQKVKIEVMLTSAGRNQRAVEQIASRLSVEPAIASVSWEATEETTDY